MTKILFGLNYCENGIMQKQYLLAKKNKKGRHLFSVTWTCFSCDLGSSTMRNESGLYNYNLIKLLILMGLKTLSVRGCLV